MKISRANYAEMKRQIFEFLKRTKFRRQKDWNDVRWMWEVYHATNEQWRRLGGNLCLRQYTKDLNDSHIETALRHILFGTEYDCPLCGRRAVLNITQMLAEHCCKDCEW